MGYGLHRPPLRLGSVHNTFSEGLYQRDALTDFLDGVLERCQFQTYHSIRHSIESAQHSLSAAVNSAMVTAYWEIGEQIYKACGENDRAGYGKKLLQYLSAHLTAEFGKGFDESNLRKMRQFYCAYPIRDTLCPELSWAHYRLLMRVPNEKERAFYAEECAKSAWSVRQLERQIHTMYYQRILASQDMLSYGLAADRLRFFVVPGGQHSLATWRWMFPDALRRTFRDC